MKLAHWTTSIAGTMLAFAVTTANATPSVNDVKFGPDMNHLQSADAYYGPVENQKGNNNDPNKISDQSPGSIESFVNSHTSGWITESGTTMSIGNGWNFLVRDNNGTGAASYGGFSFTLAAANGQNGQPNPAAWTLTVADLTPDSGLSLPFMMDFVVHMHGGGNNSFYFFDDRTVETSNAGTFQITFTNNGGNPPGLSNFDLLVRDLRDIPTQPPTEVDIPEPASMLLFGAGLLGLGLSRRRKLV